MSSQKKASRSAQRALAFQVLYSLAFTPATDIAELARAFAKAPEQGDAGEKENGAAPMRPEGFAWDLVEGVWTRQNVLDDLLRGLSQNWRIERMGKVEITLLRLALYELLFRKDIPPKVAINEAIELSKQFGDDASRGFVNGILDAAAKALDSGKLQRQ